MKISPLPYLIILVLLTACVRSPTDEAFAKQDTIALQSDIQLSAVESSLKETRSTTWRAYPTTLASQNDLHSLYFIDSKHGWVGGVEGRLYKTDDGGTSWQDVSIEGP